MKQALLEGICQLSSRGRGSLAKEVDKLLAAVARGEKLGPMTFSGGVWAYWEQGMIYLLNQRIWRAREQELQRAPLQEKIYSNFQELRAFYAQVPEQLTLPLLLENPGSRGLGGVALPSKHPLYSPLTTTIVGEGKGRAWSSPLRLILRGEQRGMPWPLRVWEYACPMLGGNKITSFMDVCGERP